MPRIQNVSPIFSRKFKYKIGLYILSIRYKYICDETRRAQVRNCPAFVNALRQQQFMNLATCPFCGQARVRFLLYDPIEGAHKNQTTEHKQTYKIVNLPYYYGRYIINS